MGAGCKPAGHRGSLDSEGSGSNGSNGSESDSSSSTEEIHYGPGFVSKLKNRYKICKNIAILALTSVSLTKKLFYHFSSLHIFLVFKIFSYFLSRYMSVALRSSAPVRPSLRRTASLENFLDKNRGEDQIELRTTTLDNKEGVTNNVASNKPGMPTNTTFLGFFTTDSGIKRSEATLSRSQSPSLEEGERTVSFQGQVIDLLSRQ